MSDQIILPSHPAFKAIAAEAGKTDGYRANAVLLDTDRSIFVANAHFGQKLKNPEYQIYLPHTGCYYRADSHADWIFAEPDFRYLRLNSIDLSPYAGLTGRIGEIEGFNKIELAGFYGDKSRDQFLLSGTARRFSDEDVITIDLDDGEIRDGMSGSGLIDQQTGNLLGILTRGISQMGWVVPASMFNFQAIPSLIEAPHMPGTPHPSGNLRPYNLE